MTYLVLGRENEDGAITNETIKLDGPGGKIRIGVGDPSTGRSSIWVVHGPKKNADIYVGNRATMGFQKVSLHESGIWRYAWTAEKASLFVDAETDRMLDRWSASEPIGAGWSIAFRIIIPEEDTHTISPVFGNQSSLSEIIWLPRPEPGTSVVLQIIVAEPDKGFVEVKNGLPAGSFFSVKEDGSVQICLVLVSYVRITEKELESQRQVRKSLLSALASNNAITATPTARMIAFGTQDDGTKYFLDLALPRELSEPQ
jgi:hypothetical protein